MSTSSGRLLAVAGARIPFRKVVVSAVVVVVVVATVVFCTTESAAVDVGTSPAAESTHVFMLVICVRAMLSVCTCCCTTAAALIESCTTLRGGMNVVNCALAIFGIPAIKASTSKRRIDTV